ncbi:MAG: hypothetical protein KC583_09755 [Myxococcales bacterium]|nr:hypothetical protein [Myxococcales bacterium]
MAGAPEDCAQTCRDESTAQAVAEYEAIFMCGEPAGCLDDQGGIDQDCLQANCGPQLDACFGAQPRPPSGDLTCAELNGCLNDCSDDDQDCVNACFTMSSPEGNDQFQATLECIRAAGCAGGDGDCQRANCQAELDACLGGPAQPMGEGTCLELNMCLSPCAGDQTCVDACYVAASPEAFAAYQAANQCIQDAGCMSGDTECQQTNCSDAIGACLNPM